MREIKYRAWDIKAQKMSMVTGLTFGGGQYSKDNIKLVATGIDRKYGQNYEVMQYTGLCDKNGVEIYEGDVIWFVPTKHAFAVEWLGDKAGFNVSGVVGKPLDNYEIIGNVYENPNQENLDSKADYQASVDEDRFQQEHYDD